mgnify:CR=1 FL=1
MLEHYYFVINKEREFQDLEEKHQVEIKLYKQRLKHLLHEQQYDISQKKAEADEALALAKKYEGDTSAEANEATTYGSLN